MYSPTEDSRNNIFDGGFYRIVGEKQYHLTDHLGNVRATVSDIKEPSGGGFLTNTITAASFYPFGFMEEGRFFFGSRNRWGFNGMEKDDEIKGAGSIYNYGFRIYNPLIGKFLSVDPLTSSYPWYTPYQFSGNNPIRFIDLDGLEEANPSLFTTTLNVILGECHLNRMNDYMTKNNLEEKNAIDVGHSTWVVYKVVENKETGLKETKFSIFRRDKKGVGFFEDMETDGLLNDDIELSEEEFINVELLGNEVIDAPFPPAGGAAKGALKVVAMGARSKGGALRSAFSFVRNVSGKLGNWKKEIGFCIPDVHRSRDFLNKGFHLHFKNLGTLELGLITKDGKLALRFLAGDKNLMTKGVKLFNQAFKNNDFRANLLTRLLESRNTLQEAMPLLKGKNLDNAKRTLNQLNKVIEGF